MSQFVLMHLGLVYIVTGSFIAGPVRRLLTAGRGPWAGVVRAFIYCPGCVGFWLGALEARLGSFETNLEPQVLVGALVGCGLGAIWASFTDHHKVMFHVEHPDAFHVSTTDDRTTTQEARPGDEPAGDRHAGPAGAGGRRSDDDAAGSEPNDAGRDGSDPTTPTDDEES